jgi:hypothetical protein
MERLCERLQRNDPALTKVETWLYGATYGYGERLGAALLKNTVVSNLSLQFFLLLSETEMEAGRTDSASCLLQFLKDSPSLQTMKLTNWRMGTGMPYPQLCPRTGSLLLELTLNAAFQNSNMQSLDLDIPDIPLTLLAQALTAYQPRLSTLRLRCDRNESSQFAATAASAAQAIAMIPSLLKLTLATEIIAPFVTPLTRSATLRHLSIIITINDNIDDADVAALCGVLSFRESALQHISLEGFRFHDVWWTNIARALQANAQVTMLTLKRCDFDELVQFAYPRSRTYRQPLQHIRTLELLDCDCASWRQRNVYFPNLSGYLPHSVHLDTLNLDIETIGIVSGLHVPNDFLIALRQNGSLHSVSVLASHPHRFPHRNPLPQVVRYMQAVTNRNRQLSQILGQPASNKGVDGVNDEGEDPKPQSNRVVLFPTLFCVARQAPRMAPKTLFLGLLSTAFDEIGPTATRRKRRIE